MWLWLVGVAVGYPLWHAFHRREAKKVDEHDKRSESQFWYSDADGDHCHTTQCLHFPSMILEHAFQREGSAPNYRLFHVRRTEEGTWERSLTKESLARELAEPEPESVEGKARRERLHSEGSFWELIVDPTVEKAYQRFLHEHEVEGPHEEGIPLRRNTLKVRILDRIAQPEPTVSSQDKGVPRA